MKKLIIGMKNVVVCILYLIVIIVILGGCQPRKPTTADNIDNTNCDRWLDYRTFHRGPGTHWRIEFRQISRNPATLELSFTEFRESTWRWGDGQFEFESIPYEYISHVEYIEVDGDNCGFPDLVAHLTNKSPVEWGSIIIMFSECIVGTCGKHPRSLNSYR